MYNTHLILTESYDDYVNMILKLRTEEINRLQEQNDETDADFLSRSEKVYEGAYATIKAEMGLPADLVPKFIDKKIRAKRSNFNPGFFPKDDHTVSNSGRQAEIDLDSRKRDRFMNK